MTHGFKRFLAEREAARRESDPIDDIREGWDLHVRYGLENPSFYGLIYGRAVPGKPCGVVAEVEAMILRALQPAARAGPAAGARPSRPHARSSPPARASSSR